MVARLIVTLVVFNNPLVGELYSYHEQVVAWASFHHHSTHLLGILSCLCHLHCTEAAILIVTHHHKGTQWLMLGTLLSTLLVRGLCFDISTPVNESLAAKAGAEVYRKDDAITLHNVFSTGNTALDTLPLYILKICLYINIRSLITFHQLLCCMVKIVNRLFH